jgi:hypothetical protein
MMDKMDLHRQTGEMIFRDLMHTTTSMARIQKMEKKIKNQWKQEKVEISENKIRINELEKCIIDLGADPNDAKSVPAPIKSKDTKIQVLKKKLKMHNVDHVQTLKLQEMKREKDLFLQQVVQINQRIDSHKHHIEKL